MLHINIWYIEQIEIIRIIEKIRTDRSILNSINSYQ